jgi:AcrR family transcriptional regulator
LTTEQVLRVALEIGLEGLTMSAVAERLGVRITVLYGYVAGKDELVRLAASYASERHDYPQDSGQHWALYVAQYAATLFTLFTGSGQLIAQFLEGGLGPEVEIDRAEVWLEALAKRGFTVEEALLLQRQMGEIVIGGAVTVLHKRALAAAGVHFERAATQSLTVREPEQIPLLLSGKATFVRRKPIWPQTLFQLLAALAARRGETLDADMLLRVLEATAVHDGTS